MAYSFVQELTLGKQALPDGAGAWAIVGSMLAALLMAPLPVIAQVLAQSSEGNLQFEVASIKHSDPGRMGRVPSRMSSPGHFVADHWPLTVLAMHAYSLKQPFEIDWKSPWMSTELYDVEARVPAGTTEAQIRVMLQHLLADRFGLTLHREIRLVPGYELVVAKGGPRLNQSVAAPARADGAALGRSSAQTDVVIKNGIPQLSESAGTGELMTRAGTVFRGRHNSIAGLTKQLAQVLQRPVVDATGLKGEYDYDLFFQNVPVNRSRDSVGIVPEGGAVTLPANPGPPVSLDSSPQVPDRPSIWDAIKEQLGLQLNAVKSLSIEVLVLDMAHQPTEN